MDKFRNLIPKTRESEFMLTSMSVFHGPSETKVYWPNYFATEYDENNYELVSFKKLPKDMKLYIIDYLKDYIIECEMDVKNIEHINGENNG